jgi:cytochrome c biogenesis protein CcdA/glutaredoxin
MFYRIFPRIFLGLAFSLLSLTSVFAQVEEIKTPVNLFVRTDCIHCHEEEEFFEELTKERNDFEVFYHNIDEQVHRDHFNQLAELEGISKSTPVILVGNTIIQGFISGDTTGVRIVELLDASKGKDTLDFEEFIAAGGSGGSVETVEGGVCEDTGDVCAIPTSKMLVKIPLIGVVDLAPYSLPTMSIILGFIDGFNPCAMWVLVTFLLVLVQIGDRRKMWEIAGLFIFAEAIMYYLILTLWFTTWDFVGMDKYVTPIIGLVAIGGGIFFLYEGITSDGTCKVTNAGQRAKISQQIKDLAHKPMTWAVAAGVIGLALSVNVIEFACSIGIPQAFTKVIELNNLGWFESQGLIGLYILFYMVDDVIVFGIALWGIQHFAAVTQKYSKYCNLLGGVLMVILGLLLILAPNLLRFV